MVTLEPSLIVCWNKVEPFCDGPKTIIWTSNSITKSIHTVDIDGGIARHVGRLNKVTENRQNIKVVPIRRDSYWTGSAVIATILPQIFWISLVLGAQKVLQDIVVVPS